MLLKDKENNFLLRLMLSKFSINFDNYFFRKIIIPSLKVIAFIIFYTFIFYGFFDLTWDLDNPYIKFSSFCFFFVLYFFVGCPLMRLTVDRYYNFDNTIEGPYFMTGFIYIFMIIAFILVKIPK